MTRHVTITISFDVDDSDVPGGLTDDALRADLDDVAGAASVQVEEPMVWRVEGEHGDHVDAEWSTYNVRTHVEVTEQ